MKPMDIAIMLGEGDTRKDRASDEITIELGGERFELDASVFDYLETEWDLACQRYDLDRTGGQKAFGQLTLLAGGAEIAGESGRKVVGVPEIEEGWRQLWVCGVGIPPHECMGLSIIEKGPALLAGKGIAVEILRDAVQDDRAGQFLNLTALSTNKLTGV